ncbi:hypothetical protein BJ912DRAFT_178362 [Pholiota molesta]|nr:hypothetical protein BJ912DRAFT_178362 [Pholiota molesta]
MSSTASSILAILATKYATVASATLLVWDIALTLNREITNVWRVKKNMGTWLFFLNRYIPPIGLAFDLYSLFVRSPSPEVCGGYQLGIMSLDVISIGIVQLVLVMRTHALYQSRTLFIWLLSGCFGSLFFTIAACCVMVLRYQTYISARLIGLDTGCLAACSAPFCRPLFIILWIPFILFETAVSLLTAWKFYNLYTRTNVQGSTQILKVIMRDGFLYYVVILSVAIANFLIWILYPPATSIAVGLLKSLQVTICSRLLLNLRRTTFMREELNEVPSTFSQFDEQYADDFIEAEFLTVPASITASSI